MTVTRLTGPLAELATHFGVERGYEGVDGQWHPADPDAVVQVLRALGAEVDGPGGAGGALEAVRQEAAEWSVPPVQAVLDGRGAVRSAVPGARIRPASGPC